MTSQAHEVLIYEGQKTSMAFCPPIPTDHPRIVKASDEDFQDETIPSYIFSTACWRRYIGTWKVERGYFYLVSLTGRFKVVGEDPLLADWFSGVIRVPKGDLLHYVHMGFGSVYESELHVEIEKGKVVTSRVVDNRNSSFNKFDIASRNLPGTENRFPGDDEI